MKKYVVEIGYDYYEIPHHHIASLMILANSLVRVEYKDYQLYERHHEQFPFVRRIELAEVNQPAMSNDEIIEEAIKL